MLDAAGASREDFLAVGSPNMFVIVFCCSDFGVWPKSVVDVEPANVFPNPNVGLEIAVAEVATFLKRSGVSTGFSIAGALLPKIGATCEDGAESGRLKTKEQTSFGMNNETV